MVLSDHPTIYIRVFNKKFIPFNQARKSSIKEYLLPYNDEDVCISRSIGKDN